MTSTVWLLASLIAPMRCWAESDTHFLDFPLVLKVAAAKAPAFAWLVRQGDVTKVMFARAPDFARTEIYSKSDSDGQPITDVLLSPDGRYIVFSTSTAYDGEQTYNPAALIEPPQPMLWSARTQTNARAMLIGPGIAPVFASDAHRLIYKHGKDLMIVDLDDASAEGIRLLAGGAAYDDIHWTVDGRALIFIADRGGYGFLGIHRLGTDRIEWLVTGADRLTAPVLSPDGLTVAYLRFPGREHTTTYDRTESEPFGLETVELGSGEVHTVWQSPRQAAIAREEDPDKALRWIGNDRLTFYSEHEGWGRLYTVPKHGGVARAITPSNCETAEVEPAGANALFVVHNCRDLHTRQISIVDARTGTEHPLESRDVVVANAASGGNGGYVAFTGGDADSAPLLRIVDLRTRHIVMREQSSDYGFIRRFAAPAPQVVALESEDGLSICGQLFMPTSKGPHPALVYLHGGPQRQMFPAFHYLEYYANNYAANRRLAELGYVVLSINYRSGTGYGQTFREAAGRGWRAASEYVDVRSAGRWLGSRSDVDSRRIGVWGGSYGGLLTAQALARNSDIFRAGIAVHGLFDWSWPSARPHHLNPSHVFGVGTAQRETAFKASPLSVVANWSSPVLLFSGDLDMNVDVLETVDLTQKLRAQGVTVRTVIVPGEAHDFVRHSTWVRLWQEQERFLSETLRR